MFSPKGPSGPEESPTASNVVAFAATFPRVRGALPAGELVVADADGVEAVGFGGSDSGTDRASVGHYVLYFQEMTDHAVQHRLLLQDWRLSPSVRARLCWKSVAFLPSELEITKLTTPRGVFCIHCQTEDSWNVMSNV